MHRKGRRKVESQTLGSPTLGRSSVVGFSETGNSGKQPFLVSVGKEVGQGLEEGGVGCVSVWVGEILRGKG
jgi:hypothetical protein